MVRGWDHNSCPIMSDQTLGWSDIMSDQGFEIIMHSAILFVQKPWGIILYRTDLVLGYYPQMAKPKNHNYHFYLFPGIRTWIGEATSRTCPPDHADDNADQSEKDHRGRAKCERVQEHACCSCEQTTPWYPGKKSQGQSSGRNVEKEVNCCS